MNISRALRNEVIAKINKPPTNRFSKFDLPVLQENWKNLTFIFPAEDRRVAPVHLGYLKVPNALANVHLTGQKCLYPSDSTLQVNIREILSQTLTVIVKGRGDERNHVLKENWQKENNNNNNNNNNNTKRKKKKQQTSITYHRP